MAENSTDKVELNAVIGEELGGVGDRNERGQFRPGHGVKGGRPKREVEQLILQGITNALTQEEITDLIKEAISIAKAQKSTKGIVAVLALVASYGLGTPIQRNEVNTDDAMSEYLSRVLAARGQSS